MRGRNQRSISWPYTAELFAEDEVDRRMAQDRIGVCAASLEDGWRAAVTPVLEQATLRTPERSGFRSRGKFGAHSEHMGHLLTELQYLQRAYPGATW